MSRICLAVAILFVAACAPVAHADWIVTPTISGGTATNVAPGGSFTVDFTMSGTAGLMQAAALQIGFSSSGLQYDSVTWQAPFLQSGFGVAQQYLDWDGVDTWVGTDLVSGYKLLTTNGVPEQVKVENFDMTLTGFAVPGLLASVTFTVPTDFAGSSVLIAPVADSQFSDMGGDTIPTLMGGGVVVNVPEPSTVAMLLSGGAVAIGCVVVRRRRQRAAQSAV